MYKLSTTVRDRKTADVNALNNSTQTGMKLARKCENCFKDKIQTIMKTKHRASKESNVDQINGKMEGMVKIVVVFFCYRQLPLMFVIALERIENSQILKSDRQTVCLRNKRRRVRTKEKN